MSELAKRARELDSRDETSHYASEIVDTFRMAENWNPSSHKRYGHMTNGFTESLSDLAGDGAQCGYQVILSYNNIGENTRAALNLQFPDVRNDKMLTGYLSYRVEPIVANYQEKVSRINREAARESIPEDSPYLNHIPTGIESEEIVGSDIVQISAPAFSLTAKELAEDLDSLGETVDRLDQFYEEEMEYVLRTSAREFLSEANQRSSRPVFSEDRDGWTF